MSGTSLPSAFLDRCITESHATCHLLIDRSRRAPFARSLEPPQSALLSQQQRRHGRCHAHTSRLAWPPVRWGPQGFCAALHGAAWLTSGGMQPCRATARHVHPDTADTQPAELDVCAWQECHGGEDVVTQLGNAWGKGKEGGREYLRNDCVQPCGRAVCRVTSCVRL